MANAAVIFLMLVSLLGLHACTREAQIPALATYRAQLVAFREEYGGVKKLPKVDFFLFGLGNRRKYLFKNNSLLTAPDGKVVLTFDDVAATHIVPNMYTVVVRFRHGATSRIVENEQGVFLEHQGQRTVVEGTEQSVKLPDFSGHKYSEILKVLHQEILINILDAKPLPNFFVYAKPWRRDAAMMAMCLQKTGNLALIREWVMGLTEPYDRNNTTKGQAVNEPDNLGQTLFLLSLFTDQSHPLVPRIVREVRRLEQTDTTGTYISGLSDFKTLPVYQTKWLKFGLASLGLADGYTIPPLADNYSSLFWWAYQEQHVTGGQEDVDDRYPYLGWARDHFYRTKRSFISNRDYPLTWEQEASQARYLGMAVIDPAYVRRQIAAPHTWHTAEIFLYLLDS